MRRVILFLVLSQIPLIHFGQIIADHRIVSDFDKIPAYYINEVKKMWFDLPGESHGEGVCWGLDDADNEVTGNTVNLDTYLNATQQYIDYCTANSIPTKVFFTTGPVNNLTTCSDEAEYQSWLKMERIRDYVKADTTRILFDYADILCYDDDGTESARTWNGHTIPCITATNLGSQADILEGQVV